MVPPQGACGVSPIDTRSKAFTKITETQEKIVFSKVATEENTISGIDVIIDFRVQIVEIIATILSARKERPH